MCHSDTGVAEPLVIFRVSPVCINPRQGSFHNPSLGQHLKCMQFIPFDDFELYVELLLYFFNQFAPVSAVCKYFGYLVPAFAYFGDCRDCPVPVLYRSALDIYGNYQPERTKDDVPFYPLYLLSCVIALLLTAHKH